MKLQHKLISAFAEIYLANIFLAWVASNTDQEKTKIILSQIKYTFDGKARQVLTGLQGNWTTPWLQVFKIESKGNFSLAVNIHALLLDSRSQSVNL